MVKDRLFTHWYQEQDKDCSCHLDVVLEFLSKAIRLEKEIKGTWIGKKEVKCSLFADDGILYVESPKESRKKIYRANKLVQKSSKI